LYYVYLIESIDTADQRYIGLTMGLRRRLIEHNSGKSKHTSKYRPWKLETYLAFSSETKARAFELYLKSGSGHALARKRF
jgi:putative endonuclease